MPASSVVVICPDRARRQVLVQRARRRFPAADVAACAGVIDALPQIWASCPNLVVVAGLDVAGRNGWRLPELRAACTDALVMTVGDPGGDLARAVRADLARPDWRIAGVRRRRRPASHGGQQRASSVPVEIRLPDQRGDRRRRGDEPVVPPATGVARPV